MVEYASYGDEDIVGSIHLLGMDEASNGWVDANYGDERG